MAKDAPFNEDLVRQLAAILNETDLTEIEYEVEGCRIKVARQAHLTQVTSTVPAVSAPTLIQEQISTKVLPIEGASETQDIAKHPGAIKSPMVGNAYLAPSPEAEPFVKIGDKVTKGQNILIIEAMKVMNPIKAPRDGRVTQVLVKNGEPIEFDQVLMIIE